MPGHTIILEICCQDLASVDTALAAGAHRIELCTALDRGGLTPSYGLVTEAVSCAARFRRKQESTDTWANPAVMVLVRPRAGGFVYTHDELQVMCADIRAARTAGAQGVVLGCLKATKDTKLVVDEEAMATLLRVVGEAEWSFGGQTTGLAKSEEEAKLKAGVGRGEVTFHRAFDDVDDPLQALDDITSLNAITGGLIKRILTSGSSVTAEQGIDVLRQVCARAKQVGGRIGIMPGAGITRTNVTTVIENTGCRQVHASAKMARKCAKDDSRLFHVNEIVVTDGAEVKGLLAALQEMDERR